MEVSRIDVVLHPVRWRVIQALMGRQLTTSELKERLVGVAATTLYRQVGILAEADVIRVVAERRVRGTVERTYGLTSDLQTIGEADELSREQLGSAFGAFTAGLTGDFERYLERESIDPDADHINFTQSAIYLTDEEFDGLADAMGELLRPYLRSPEDASTKVNRMLLSTILIPAEG